MRINCPAFKDYKVVAYSKEEAIEAAINQYNCDQVGGELGEVLDKKNFPNGFDEEIDIT